LTTIALRVAFVTVNEETPICPASDAVTAALPGALPMAVPNDPEASLIVTTDGFDDVQTTEFVRSCIVPSVRVPVAVKLTDVFCAKLAFGGEIVMAVNSSTAKFAVPLTPFREQVMVTAPAATPVAIFPLSEANPVSEDDQAQTVARGCVLWSLNVPRAFMASVEPTAMPTFVGVTAIEVNVAGLTVSGADPVTGVTPPKEAEIDVEPDATPVARPTLPDELLMVATGI
jgi:hypothetical protein